MEKMIRPRELAENLGLGLSTLYDKMKTDPEFPPKVRLGKGSAIAFKESDIEEWLAKYNDPESTSA